MANNGKIGERKFHQIMLDKGYQVQDVSKNPEYYYKCDFIVTSPTTGITKTFEVKWDEQIWYYGNLFLEIWNDKSQMNQLGWYEYCTADYVAYGDAKNDRIYIIDMQRLKQRVEVLVKRKRECKNKYGEVESIGLVVSLDDVKDITEEILGRV